MPLFAHHIEVELFDVIHICPETPLEHAVAFGIAGVLFMLMVYGAYAGVRDFLKWRRERRVARQR